MVPVLVLLNVAKPLKNLLAMLERWNVLILLPVVTVTVSVPPGLLLPVLVVPLVRMVLVSSLVRVLVTPTHLVVPLVSIQQLVSVLVVMLFVAKMHPALVKVVVTPVHLVVL